MATQLFLLDSVSDTHLGTDNTNLLGTAVGWTSKALGTARGSGVVASDAVATVTGATAGVTITKSSSPVEWISPPVAADVTISGTVTLNLWSSETNMSANVAINARIFVIRGSATATRNSNTLDTIATSARVIEVAVTTRAANNFTVTPTSTAVSRGDRLRVVLFGDDVGTMAATYTFDASWNGASASADGDSHVTFTENVTFENPPGLTAINNNVTADAFPSIQGGSTAGLSEELAQSFVSASVASTLTEVQVELRKNLAPTDDLVLEIQSNSGGNLPSGSVVGTVATISAASISTTTARYSYSCSIALAASTTYWLVARRSGTRDTTNYYFWNGTSGSNYANGVGASRVFGSWGAGSGDQIFVLTHTAPTTAVYLTNTQSGLTGAPALVSSFTGSDESPLSEGGNWANLNTSLSQLVRVSNQASAAAIGTCASYWTPANFGPDLEAYLTTNVIGSGHGIVFRVQGEGGAGTWDGYRIDHGGSTVTIRRVDNAVNTTLIASTAVTWGVGDKLGVRAVGSTLQAWRLASGGSDWNLVCSAVDATYPSAGKVGIYAGGTTNRIDDFYAATGSNLFTQKAWTSRGSGVVSYLSDTAAGWTAPLLTNEWFSPPLTAFTLTGMAQANIRALESNALANASLRAEIARVEGDGTSPTVWCSWCCAPTGTDNGELTTSEVARTINLSGDDLAITNGQRLRIRLYNEDMSSAAMADTYNVQRFYNGTSGGASGDSYITFPQTLTEYASGPYVYTKAGYGIESG